MKAPNKFLRVGVGLMFAGAFFLAGNARSLVQAHSTTASLPTLRMTYWASKNKLARRLDPALINATNEADTAELTNANLIVIGTDDKVHLSLAKSLKVTNGGKTYTFQMKHAHFADGHAVTAADVVYSVKRALAASTASSVATTYLGILNGAVDFNSGKSTSLPGVKATGKYTVQFKIIKAYAYFLDTLAYPTSDVLDPALLSGKTATSLNNYLTNNCPGNRGEAGQFEYVCSGSGFYPTGQTPSYTLQPNPRYFGHKAHIRIVMHAYGTADEVYKAYQAGAEDVAGIPTAHIAQWLHNKQFRRQPTSAIFYFSPNIKSAPFSNVNCRLAFDFGINRDFIDSKVLHNAATAAYTVVPKGFLGYYNSKFGKYNLKKAKAYFKKCSFKSTPVGMVYATGSTDADNQAASIVAEEHAVGFNIKAIADSENDWLNVVSNPLTKTNTQIVLNGWQQDYPDPQDYFENLLTCDVQSPGPTSYDISSWCNRTFGNIDKKADLELNTKKRQADYVAMDKIVTRAGIWIPINVTVDYFLIKPYVHGITTTVAQVDTTAPGLDWSKVRISKH